MDFVAILLLTLITIPVALFTDGIPRALLGIIVLLFFPGYTLTLALFPGIKSLRGIERAGLTLILSFALVSLSGLILNYTPWGIRLTPVLITVSTLIVLFVVISFLRRIRLPEDERFILKINIRRANWPHVSRVDRILFITLAVVVIGSLSTLTYVIARPKAEEAFSNFYMLGPSGLMENYPQTVVLGGQADITLGIENHEHQSTNYSIKATFDSQEMQTIGPLTLADEEKWSYPISLNPSRAGQNQKAEFSLYKNESPEPYLTLRLWLDVTEK